MSRPYLEITYRQGKPLAAYLYLERRSGDRVARSERHETWLIEFTADGRAIGIEFTQVGAVDLAAVNQALAAHRQPAIHESDLAPLRAA